MFMMDFLDQVPGQSGAVAQLRAALVRSVHAYLLVGPAGSGTGVAARAFAAALLDDERVMMGMHPDVVIVEREGASISVAQAREIGRLALQVPVEGDRKVLILEDLHLVDEAAPALLKTIEEASASTVFVITAESVPQELVTVASRCVRIDFATLGEDVVEECLVTEGFPRENAVAAAEAAFGNLERARLLAADDGMGARRALWVGAPNRLDGTGSAVTALTDEIIASLDGSLEPLLARQSSEAKQLGERVKAEKLGAMPMKTLETRHKREQRRLRVDELRAGLATLAREYRKLLESASGAASALRTEEALDAIQWASESLTYNPNEALLLNGLFVRCSQDTSLKATGARR